MKKATVKAYFLIDEDIHELEMTFAVNDNLEETIESFMSYRAEKVYHAKDYTWYIEEEWYANEEEEEL